MSYPSKAGKYLLEPEADEDLGGLLAFGTDIRMKRQRLGVEAADRALQKWNVWLRAKDWAAPAPGPARSLPVEKS
jgi:hypothetical protein